MTQHKSALTETLDMFNGTNVEQMNRNLKGYGITIEREGDKFVAISTFGTVYRTYNADGSVESDINNPTRSEIDEAGMTLTVAQECEEQVDAVSYDFRIPRQSQFSGSVRDGDTDNAAQILEESFRGMLLNPRSNLVSILGFYARGGTLKRKSDFMSDGDYIHDEAEAVEDSAETYTNVKPETVNSASDERTVNNVMRHGYRVLSDKEKADMLAVKDMGLAFWNLVDSLGSSRELSNAKTRIEEAVMWAIKDVSK